MTVLFPPSEFDAWAETYDQSVLEYQQFPFDGYERALDTVVALAQAHPNMSVLDMGTGTGNLALRFARLGCKLWCMDFSEAMLAKARQKLPGARFVLSDLRAGWPSELEREFDRIVSAYVLHHFALDEKVRIVKSLAARLAPGGRMVIADIAFPDAQAMEMVKVSVGEDWEDEFYWLADESLAALQKIGLKATYRQVSSCAGVFVIQPA